MYSIFMNDEILHHPLYEESGRVVIEPVLHEKLNTHGSLEFSVAPTNPLCSQIKPRLSLIRVESDSRNNKPWFGRVVSVERGWNNILRVYCEGELGCLVDCVYQPFGFKGTPSVLWGRIFVYYNTSGVGGSHTYLLRPGNVTVVAPFQTSTEIVRSSKSPLNLWDLIDEKLFSSTLGGYVIPRYDRETDTHYVDYLADFDVTSTQVVRFGENLLDFEQMVHAEDVITSVYPYGAELNEGDPGYAPDPPENGAWNGNRLTVESVNNGNRNIDNATGIAIWGKIHGSHTWDDITIAQNLYDAASEWLAQQIWESMTLELSAVDLAFVDVDIDQIQVGEYVRCESAPHDLNMRMLCTEKRTYLTRLEDSVIILGAGQKTLTDLQGKELKQ